jgi:hypothetical protein
MPVDGAANSMTDFSTQTGPSMEFPAMLLHQAKPAVSSVLFMLGFGLTSPLLHADTRTSSDYIAIVVEAEDYSTREERWVLTDLSTPAQENDPDPNHSDQAVGQAYLELLPDMRVTHADEFGPPTAIWNQPGTGPRAEYPLYFPEAGRYYVHVRAYSTGTEDNGLHIGLDGDFPESGARLQFCTAGQGWQWSSRQRDSGGMGACGAQKTIWVTVPSEGVHTFMISAREDGFEIDRIMLIKDLSSNTRICKPAGADDISCVDGSLENVDDVVDMAVELERTGSESTDAQIVETIDLAAIVRNQDGYDTAGNVVLNLQLGSEWELLSLDEACVQVGTGIDCNLGNVPPSGPEGERAFDFSVKPLQSGELSVEATVSSDSIDGQQDNDTASLTLAVTDEDSLSKLTALIAEPASAWVGGTESTLQFTVTNDGPAVAQSVAAVISLPGGVIVTSAPAACVVSEPLVCSWPQLAVDESVSFSLGVTPANAGLYSVTLTAEADNQDGSAADQAFASVIVTVAAPASVPPVAGPEPEQEASASPSDGGGSISIWLFCLMGVSLLLRPINAVRPSPLFGKTR